MDNATRKYLLQRHRQSGFPGSVMDVFRAHDQGIDLIGQFEQQNNIQVARSPQQQKQGLRPAHQAGNVSQSMIFPNVPPNTPFTTEGMKAPINIEKYDEQGHLVKSYENVPPGIKELPMGPQGGTVIETPANMQAGGDYNMARAKELGYKPDATGHYPSVDDETGMLLKSKEHPTVKLEFMSQMLSPERKMIANPTGYFGENQLQYVPRKKMQLGGFDYTPPIAQAIEAAGGFDEYQAKQDLAANLNELNSRPTISQGNFDVDEDGMIVEENPSFLEMAANPMATLRTVVDPSVEGLPSEVEFEKAKSKGNAIGQVASDLVNPAAYVNYGVNAVRDLGQATNYAVQGEGVKALSSFGSSAMNALGAVPAFGVGVLGKRALKQAGVTGVGDLYKANPYLKNPMGFRNVGDKPNFLFGYNKKIDPMRMDFSPEAGFNQFLGRRNVLDKQFRQGSLGHEAHEEALSRLYNQTPFESPIGQGSFGAIHPIRNTDYVMKMGHSSGVSRTVPSRYSGMSDDFIDRASDMAGAKNVAVPLRSSTIPETNFGPVQIEHFKRGTRNVTAKYQPIVPQTELTLMKRMDTANDVTHGGAGFVPHGATLPTRDQFASALRQARQMRDRGIGIDLDNMSNIRFNAKTGDFNLFDLENVPQLAGRNPREFAQLQARYGEMLPYPKSEFQFTPTYTSPFEYMHEVRRVMGMQGAGIPDKTGKRLIGNFDMRQPPHTFKQSSNFAKGLTLQEGGPRKVLTMGLPGRVDVVGDLSSDNPAQYADLLGRDFNQQWNNSAMSNQMLSKSFYRQNYADSPVRSVLDMVSSPTGPLGTALSMSLSQLEANDMRDSRNESLFATSFQPTRTDEEFAAAYEEGYGGRYPYKGGAYAFYNPITRMTSYAVTANKPTAPGKGQFANDYLHQVGVHERSHASDHAGNFIPEEDLRMMEEAKLEGDPNTWQKYIQNPTETRARLMEMRRTLYNEGVDVLNSPVSEGDFNKYLRGKHSGFLDLKSSYKEKDILKMLNSIAYEGDNNLPQNVAKRGGKRPMRKYFKLRK